MPRFITQYVRNQSSSWSKKRLIVIHTSEGHNRQGLSDLYALASWFNNPVSKASAHKGIDAEGNKITMVADSRKAWHAGIVNSYSYGVEQIGFASSTKAFWIRNFHNGLVTFAKQIADWSIKDGIPIQHSKWRGICTHNELPGEHWDPGPNYPLEYLLLLATVWKWRKNGAYKRHPDQYARMVSRIKAAQDRAGVPKAARTIHWR